MTAHQSGNANYNAAPDVSQTFSIAKANQTITFAALPGKTYGAPPFTVVATATSGLPVTFTVSGACTNSGANGATVTVTGVGSCTVTAHQAGNANYNAAPDVPQTFSIAKANQTITFAALPDKTYGDPPFTVVATATSGLPVTFTVSGACTNSGTNGATVTLTGAGSCTVTAHQAGNANYNAAPDVPQTFSIAKANQTIAFAALPGKTYGDPPFTVVATASSGLPVTFTVSGACINSGANGATVTVTGVGTCTVTAHQAGNANYNAAPDVPRTFNIAKANQTIAFGALPDKTYRRPAVHGRGDGDVGLAGDVHGEWGVQHRRCDGDGDRGGQLHGDGASGGQRHLQRRAGRAADFHDCQGQPDNHVWAAAGPGGWRPALHSVRDGDVGLGGDVHGERGVQLTRAPTVPR